MTRLRSLRIEVLLLLCGIALAPKELAYVQALIFARRYVGVWRKADLAVFLPWIVTMVFILIRGGLSGNLAYDVVKDVYYWSILPVFFACGLALGRNEFVGRTEDLLYIATLASTSALIITSQYSGLSADLSRDEYRAAIGYATPIAITIAPIALVACFGLHVGVWRRTMAASCLATIAVSTYLSDSRTQALFVMISLAVSLIPPSARTAKSFVVLALLLVLCLGTPLWRVFLTQDQFLQFTSSLPPLVSEWIPFGYTDLEDINTKWRAFEGFAAYTQWVGSGLSDQLFGQGAGVLVYLGLEMHLGSESFSSIPTLHNGLMYALTKAGIVGLIYVVGEIWGMLRISSESGTRSRVARNVSLVSLLYLVFGFPTTSGFFGGTQQITMVLLFLGLSCGDKFAESRLARSTKSRRLDCSERDVSVSRSAGRRSPC